MNRIRQLRLIQGLTQEALAERADLSVSYLSEIENGRVTPSLKALKRIAAVLKLPVYSLLDSGESGNGNVAANFGNNFNNFGTNFGNADLTTNNSGQDDTPVSNSSPNPSDSSVSPIFQQSSVCNSFVCPFIASMTDSESDGMTDPTTLMIIASLHRMPAEKRHRLLQYIVKML